MLTDATIADYYCKGIETALLPPEQARAWADSVIASTEEPLYEYIEVSLSNGVPELISALSSFPGERDPSKIGPWLLAKLQQTEVDSVEGLASAVRAAMLVCRHCGMTDEVHYEFDCIDDSLYLARHGQYGSVDQCRADFLTCLRRHAQPFPSVGEAQPVAPADRLQRPVS
jgi:hypothetical protein